MKTNTNDVTLSSSALLVTLSLSAYTGNKLDRSVSEEIDQNKNTTTRAGKYTKSLFADEPSLKAIAQHDSETRQVHKRYTLPWSFAGVALLPMGNYMNYMQVMGKRAKERAALVSEFIDNYQSIIAAQAFKLGDLFDREDYLLPHEVEQRFEFNIQYSPLPEAGDFRVDIGNEGLSELRSQYEKQIQDSMQSAMNEVYNRLKTILTRMVTQLREVDEGDKKPKIYDSLLGNAKELVDMIPTMNITNDPELDEARRQLLSVIDLVDTEGLKKSDVMRKKVFNTANDILDKFNW